MNHPELGNYRIPVCQQVLQIPARLLVNRIFPTAELDRHSKDNLELAHDMLVDGYGLLVAMNHFAKPEFFFLFSKLFSDREFSRRGGLMALGAHEYRWYIIMFAKTVGVDTIPVVVSSTAKALGIKTQSFGMGLGEYLEVGGQRLAQGGTVLALPQGQREPKLGEARSTLIYDLLDEAKYRGGQKLAVIPAGIGLLGNADYENRGFHFFERGVVRFRPPQTYEDIMAAANGDPKGVERLVFEELRQAVPENYR